MKFKARVLPAILVVLPSAMLVGQIAWKQKSLFAAIIRAAKLTNDENNTLHFIAVRLIFPLNILEGYTT